MTIGQRPIQRAACVLNCSGWWGEHWQVALPPREPFGVFVPLREIRPKLASIFTPIHGYSRPFTPIHGTPPSPSFFGDENQKSSFTAIFPFKAIQKYSKAFKAVQRLFQKKRLFIFPVDAPSDHPGLSALWPKSVFIRVHPWFKNLQKARGSARFPTAADQKFTSIEDS